MKKLFVILTLAFISTNAFTEILYFKNCKEARSKGYKNIKKGEPGYARHLDRDRDGIACESK
ncbi:excalibur calcium-binding domain-containing protein [Leptotrichia shahii]|uniref:excalibur calcium-binding domain-containing protein n=1 Tax=Leptotrichia shahii TaxID=157691 RepID=UPI0028D6376A|nr:excalibur calcium-binding domain-containing protein [Leptotrichia shahii]